MTAEVFGPAPDTGPDPLSVHHVAPFVAYLAGPAADAINGQVFVVHGGTVAVLAGPTVAERFSDAGTGWTTEQLRSGVGAWFAERDPDDVFAGPESG
jgi:3-oxoacyl-[acyl-carrier protein] reductase